MTNLGLVLTLFSGLAVLSVATIVVAAFWSHSRTNAQDRRELAFEAAHPDANPWLGEDQR